MTINLITLTDPQSAAAEAYQSLRTRLEFSRLGQEVKKGQKRERTKREKRSDKILHGSHVIICNCEILCLSNGHN